MVESSRMVVVKVKHISIRLHLTPPHADVNGTRALMYKHRMVHVLIWSEWNKDSFKHGMYTKAVPFMMNVRHYMFFINVSKFVTFTRTNLDCAEVQ